MHEWQKTACVLCAQNCGLLLQIEDNRIVKVKGDRENPRSCGYLCRKGANIANFQHHDDRLTSPLKRTEDGFIEISWAQAYSEIGTKLRQILDQHGPTSLAFIGSGGQGSHMEAAFATSLLKAAGSRYHYTALAQELTGFFWCSGRLMGRQNKFPIPDEHGADMLLAIGWNGMVSHQMPRAPLILKEFSRNPEKLLVSIDPRKSETARAANIHIALAPGTDALLARAMIAIILQEGWENKEYLTQHTTGFDRIRSWFDTFDIQGALAVCNVEYEQTRELCQQLSRRRWCMHTDLGVIMNRHSTLASYLYLLLAAVCGRLCVEGGNVIPGNVVPLGSHSDERRERTWRTKETDYPEIFGVFPPNVFPEEVLSNNPERLRAAIVSSSNPLRSFADTTQWEKSFNRLELKVTIDIAMTETAALSDYVLPALSPYESYDASFFTWNYPETYFQLRHPLLVPDGQPRESGQIIAEIADSAGLVPDPPEYLVQAARKDRVSFTAALLPFIKKNPKYRKILPLIVSKVRNGHADSNNLDALWGLFLASPKVFRKNAARAGFPMESPFAAAMNPGNWAQVVPAILRCRSLVPLAILTPGIAHARKMFETCMNNRSGFWIGKMDWDNMSALGTKDKKIHLYIEEMEEWLREIDPEQEREALKPDPAFPFILNAGRHMVKNANNLMRKPDWNRGKRTCTVAMNPKDGEQLGIKEKEIVLVTTEAAAEKVEVELSSDVRPGQVLIPHGFGLLYKGVQHGIPVNRLTSAGHRDRLAATPIHRYVPCRIEKVIQKDEPI